MPITDETQHFTALSALLTGFDEAALEATGLAEVYRAVAARRLGAERYGLLLGASRAGWDADAVDGELRDAAREVAFLWYTGSWPGTPPVLVSARAHAEALVWKAAGLTAPAADPGGHGSWAGPSTAAAGRSGR
ncbi:hypothetical protein ACQKM2_12560 [Streptomyces sp. NPDC004126]|uniref:hypothetical protein n=1 Tax=Streptomyces sp. NPDC004126 TaxID=3390695 RepID=UPI003D0009C7